MLEVLIVDDETKVCWLLEQIIDWETLHAKCIGTAVNGVEAYSYVKKHKPDVVITDIRMPDMDGLELVRRVKEVHQNCIFIIISGYQQFEYAHAAIKYGVADFLLKPINKDEINAVLKRIVDQKTQKKQMYSVFLQEQKEHRLKEREMRSILANLLEADSVSQSTMEYFQPGYPEGAWMCIAVRVDQRIPVLSEEEEDFFHTRAAGVIKTELMQVVVCRDIYYKGVLLLVLNGKDSLNLEKLPFEEYRDTVQRYLIAYSDCRVTFAKSRICMSIDDLCESARQVRNLLDARISGLYGRVIVPGDVSMEEHPEVIIRSSDAKRFLNGLGTLDFSICRTAAAECMERLENREILKKYRSVLCTVYWMIEKYILTLKGMGFITTEDLEKDTSMLQLYLRNANEIRLLKQGIADYMGTRIAEYQRQKADMDSRPVLMARQYVDEHTESDCSLQEVANFVRLSPNYFSAVFSDEVGMTFKDYVTEVKIARAKQLLTSTNDKINVISEKVGYRDAKYFSRLFEKKVSLKPAQYRKIMR